MGVTTIVMGNCGGSYLNIGEAFTSHTRQGVGVNVASLLGHNTVRSKVMGNVARDPSTTELQAMKDLVAKACRMARLGYPGLIYTPGIFTKTPEIVELAKATAQYGGIYATHQRSEGINVIESINEALTVGREAHMPVEISHIKITAPKRFGQAAQILEMLDKARSEGQDVTFDQYAYAASSTGISTMLPEWAVEGTSEAVRARLADPKRARRPSLGSSRNAATMPGARTSHTGTSRTSALIHQSTVRTSSSWQLPGNRATPGKHKPKLSVTSSPAAAQAWYSIPWIPPTS